MHPAQKYLGLHSFLKRLLNISLDEKQMTFIDTGALRLAAIACSWLSSLTTMD